MKLITWNVNGIRSAIAKGLLEFVREQRPEILCLQETKAQPEQVIELLDSLANDYCFYFSSALKKGYSGVATFVRKDVEHSKESVSYGLGQKVFDNEGRYLILEVGQTRIYNIYFPSGTSGEDRQDFKYAFLEHLLAHLKALSQAERSRLIICGDVNICHREMDIHHPKEATRRALTGFLPAERAWIDRFLELGFFDCYRQFNPQKQAYTWWSFRANSRAKNLGWRIDYVFSGRENISRIASASILTSPVLSDHAGVEVCWD